MSPPIILVYIVRDGGIRRAFSMKAPEDAELLLFLSHLLVGKEQWEDKLLPGLEQIIRVTFEDAYDFVNPYGDRRSYACDSVWTFDLDEDTIFSMKKDASCSVSLRLARERLLTLEDFVPTSTEEEPLVRGDQALPEPYWEPELHPIPREKAFLGRILRDFADVWRHILRRQFNSATFMKLAYAIVWISKREFTLLERIKFEHMARRWRGPYAAVVDLPGWETPAETLVPVGSGSSWFVLSQDIWKGLEMVRGHEKSRLLLTHSMTDHGVTYIILTVRHVVLCRALGDDLAWTESERLFDGSSVSDIAIDMILWAVDGSCTMPPQRTRLERFPLEIQDIILHHATPSSVASAKLGCELGLGSPFSWLDRGGEIGLEDRPRNRAESSPVESQVMLNGSNSGLSYKRQSPYMITYSHKLIPHQSRRSVSHAST